MDRESYLASLAVVKSHLESLAALKKEIKALSAAQKQDKTILRMPRKTPTDRAAFTEALNGTGYAWKDASFIQSTCTLRRPKITAYLIVYAELRGKGGSHRPGKDYYLPVFQKHLEEARRLCDSVVAKAVIA